MQIIKCGGIFFPQTCGVKGAVTPAFQSSATSMPNSTISALMAGEKKSLGHESTA